MRKFLFGMLTGVLLAYLIAQFSFRGINESWQLEVWKRGGAIYHFDPQGNVTWRWAGE